MKFFRLFIAIMFFNGASAQIKIETNLPASVAPNTSLNLEVKITKGSISSFSKYQLDVPAGVTIAEKASKTGNFSFEAPRAKIVWVAIPADTAFIVTFVMNTGSASGPGVFNQKLYYVDESGKKEFEAEPLNITIDPSGATTTTSFPEIPSSSAVASNSVASSTYTGSETSSTTSANTNTTVAVNTNTTAKEKEAEPVSKTKEKESTSTKTSGGENTSSKGTAGLVFKIQLGAFGANPGKSKFAAAGKVNISQEDGLFKVLYGSFNTKEDALQKLENLRSKGMQGFVVKYQDGVRVK